MTGLDAAGRPAVGAALRASYAAQRRAMVTGDSEALGDLLGDGFTLTHMTGYEQSKEDWLADVRSGAMAYHDIRDAAVTVDLDGELPSLTARTTTEATIWGTHGTWRLELRIVFAFDGTRWRAVRTVAATW